MRIDNAKCTLAVQDLFVSFPGGACTLQRGRLHALRLPPWLLFPLLLAVGKIRRRCEQGAKANPFPYPMKS